MSKKRINSRSKGKRGELQVAHYLTDRGFPATRGAQHSGSLDSPDVKCESLSNFQIEVKFTERGNPYDWIEQAIRDSKQVKTPLVIHRRSNKPWLAIMLLDDFLGLVK